MKQVRIGSFETNSSSTHCFGVVSAEDFEKWDSEKWWLDLSKAIGGNESFMEDDWSIENDWKKYGYKYPSGVVDASIVDINGEEVVRKLRRSEGMFGYTEEELPLCFDIWPKSQEECPLKLEGELSGPFTKHLDDGRVFVATFCY